MMIVSIVLLNLLWFTSVLGAANGLIWPASIVLVILLGFNYLLVGMHRIDFKIISYSFIAGLIIDGILMNKGLVIYEHMAPGLGWMPPLWILMLWVGFGASVRLGMHWLLENPKLGGAVMLVGAPLSYISASKLGATTVPNLWQAMTFIGCSWLLYFMSVVYLLNKDGSKNAMA